jgi:formyl-CoA transferase
MQDKPLLGYRVLDMTNVLAGPFCCHQLAHLGADVIKVEAPGRGDLARQLGSDAGLNDMLMGISFLAQNPGKRSVTLNLKAAEGKTLLTRLVAGADVIVENFRPGVMDRLGLGFDQLRVANPRLVYCAISGFGQDGPLRDLPAYDQIIQGMSGLMSITGSPETAPYRAGFPVADTIGGLTAAFAIAGTLAGKSRPEAVLIDVSMLESVLATMGWVVSNYLMGGQVPAPHGNENITSAPSGTFQAADGPLNIAANKQEQFEAVCRVIGRLDLIDHVDYRGRDGRKANRYALKAEIEQALAADTAASWVDRLNAAGVPSGLVLTVPEILAEPQIRDRGMLGLYPNVPGVGRDLRIVGAGFKLSGKAPAVNDPPPTLGQHNAEVFGELGLDQAELARLEAAGVI